MCEQNRISHSLSGDVKERLSKVVELVELQRVSKVAGRRHADLTLFKIVEYIEQEREISAVPHVYTRDMSTRSHIREAYLLGSMNEVGNPELLRIID